MIFKDYDEERKYLDQVEAWFEEAKDEYLAFDKVEPKRNKRADLHAMLLLDSLCEDERKAAIDMISWGGHDEIGFSVEPRYITLTKDLVIELIRCGVRYEEDMFKMFV